MWLKSFSKRTPSAYFIYVVVVLLLLNIPLIKNYIQFFQSLATTDLSAPFYQTYAVFLIPIIAFLLSFLINRVFINSDTFNRNTLWPGYLFVLFVVAMLNQFTVIDLVTHGVIGIILVSEILRVQYNRDARFQCYNIGLLLGIAMLIQTPMLMLVPVILYALLNLKPLTFRETILYFLGLSTPIYFLLAYCFLVSDYTLWAEILFSMYDWFSFNNPIETGFLILWIAVTIALIILIAITFYNYNSLPVYIRRVSSALMYLIVGVFVIGVSNLFRGFLIFYLAPAFAFFATMLMLRYPNNRIVPIIHFIFVVLLISLQLANNYLL